jgi:chemotaxis-related protein WspB
MLALTFQVGPDRVAVNVSRIREVVPRVRLSPVNGAPSWIAGVFVYRGRVVPVVDLHRFTGVGECPLHLSSRIILLPYPVNAPDSLVGLLATQVADIREIPITHRQTESGSQDSPGLGQAYPDGAIILRILDPDSLLRTIAAQSSGLIALGTAQ